MVILDCETRESALETVASIFGSDATSLGAFLSSFDLETHAGNHGCEHPMDEELQRVVEATFGCAARPLDRVHWFHLTRTLTPSAFEIGILPLTKSIDVVWDTFLDVFRGTVHEERLRTMRKNGVNDYQYNLKAKTKLHAGPYAVLVKEFALRPNDFCGHDYLRLPEIMEDICSGYEKDYGEAIAEPLIAVLKPVIVKFWTPPMNRTDLAEAALFYLYCGFRNDGFGMNANTCYDAQNKAVLAEQIIYCRLVENDC
jgi:hypothetical protein